MSGAELILGARAELVMGLLAALGSGLLIGLERERNKQRARGGAREPAGLRTFTLAALAGALAQGLASPGLVAVGALAVSALVAIAYLRSSPRDPGLTTEIALLVTYLIGVLCIDAPLLGAPAAIVLTALLAARSRLHRFATKVLREQELHDGLLLGALALVVLPLMPTEPLPWLGGMKAHSLLALMLLLLVLQAIGHVALRLAGPQTGLAIAGLMSGLVSSSATIAAMGARARAEPAHAQACAAAAVMSTAATWLQAALMLVTVAPAAALAYLPVGLAGTLVAGGAGWAMTLASRGNEPRASVSPAQGHRLTNDGPLRLREAALIALLLSAVTVGVNWAEQRFGSSGLFGAVALAGLADAHSPVASLAALSASGQIGSLLMLQAVLVAIASNSLQRSLTGLVAGGALFGRRVALVLAASLLAATLALWGISFTLA